MATTTLSFTEFQADTISAFQAAAHGPVIVTDHERPAHVLITIEQYQSITQQLLPASPTFVERQEGAPSIVDLLSRVDAGEIDFDPPNLGDMGIRAADFS